MKNFNIIFIVLAFLFLCACTTLQTATTERFVWPLPPNEPRIEWLGTYKSQLDLPPSQLRKLKEFIAGEDNPISLKKPIDAKLNPQTNKLYVADIEKGVVYIFDLTVGELNTLTIDPEKTKESVSYFFPISLAINQITAELYVLDPRTRKILLFDKEDQFRGTISISGITERPVSIAVDPVDKLIYISDVAKNKIFAVDQNGTVQKTFGGPGEKDGEFNRPVSITINNNNEIIVADAFNARIQIFNKNGVFVRSFGKRGDGVSDFQLIKSVAIDPDDNIYVVDARTNSIKIFDSKGASLLTFGGYYASGTTGKITPGGFALPMSIDINSKGEIAIVDQLNSRVQLFRYLPSKKTDSK